MPRYHFEGKDASGATVREALDCTTKAEALSVLNAWGWTDVEFIGDDAGTGWPILKSQEEVERGVDRSELADSQKLRSPGAHRLWQIRRLYRKAPLTYASLFLILAARWYLDSPWGWFDGLCSGLLLLPFLTGLWASFAGPVVAHQRYQEAMFEARWEDALAALRQLESTLEPLIIGGMRANCLAGLGRQDEAYALLEQLRVANPGREYHYLNQAISVFGTAGDHLRQREAMLRALEIAPDPEIMQLDLARLLATRFRDPTGSRHYLALGRAAVLPTWATFIFPFIEGVLAYEEGDLERARSSLVDAQAKVEPFLKAAPGLRGMNEITTVYLAMVAAQLGDQAEAERLAVKLRPWLEAHRDQDMLDRLKSVGL